MAEADEGSSAVGKCKAGGAANEGAVGDAEDEGASAVWTGEVGVVVADVFSAEKPGTKGGNDGGKGVG
jgi:hypothetical protein